MKDYILKQVELVFADEICEIDVSRLYYNIIKMPADKYMELYYKIKSHIETGEV